MDCIINQLEETEKMEITKFQERVSALQELEISLDDLNLKKEEKNNILSNINEMREETDKLIKNWCEKINKKYNFEKITSFDTINCSQCSK